MKATKRPSKQAVKKPSTLISLQMSVRPKVILPIALAALIIGGGVYGYTNADSIATIAESVGISQTNTATVISSATLSTFKFSYTNLDKSANSPDGKEQTINAQAAGIPVGVTLSLNKATVDALKKYTNGGTSLATLKYDLYQGYITKTGGVVGASPIFSNPFIGLSMKANKAGTGLTTTLPLDFTRALLPGSYYSLHIYVMAADSSFNVDDYIQLNIVNTAMCQLKG